MSATTLLVAASRAATVAAIATVVAVLPWLSGRDPALSILRARSAEQEPTPEALDAIRRELGLDAGPASMLADWVGGLLRGDPGRSWNTGAPVLPGALDALGVSLTLMACAMVVAAATAAAVAAPAFATGLRGTPRRTGGAAAAALTSLPEFLLASVFVVAVAVWLPLPPYGWDGPASAVLPALALGLPAGGLLGRLAADAVAATFTEEWVATWVAAGFPRRTVAVAVARRALASLMPQVGLVMVGVTGGAVAVEKVFAIPGLGRSTLGDAHSQDIPALQVDILLLLGVGVALGAASQLVRRLLLGRAGRAGALPVPAGDTWTRRGSWAVPALAAGLLAAVVAAGLPRDPHSSAHAKFAPPSWALPLGADASGRDMLARLSHGAVATVGTALAVTVACFAVGLLLGLAPRLTRGPVEAANAVPPVLAGILVAAAAGTSAAGAATAVLLVSWAPLAAHTAALVDEVRARPYIAVLPTLGAGRARILFRSVLPEVVGPVLRHAMLRLPGVALALAALGFLGLGPQPPSPDWGLVLADGIGVVERAPWVALSPLVALVALAVLAVSLSSLAAGTRRPDAKTPHPVGAAR